MTLNVSTFVGVMGLTKEIENPSGTSITTFVCHVANPPSLTREFAPIAMDHFTHNTVRNEFRRINQHAGQMAR